MHHPEHQRGSETHFLDQSDYSQYTLPTEDLAEESKYITEELEGIRALIYNDACVGIQLPAAVELTITQCDPGVKGDSATSRAEPATPETELVIQVPEQISQGERMKVDTRTNAHLSRA